MDRQKTDGDLRNTRTIIKGFHGEVIGKRHGENHETAQRTDQNTPTLDVDPLDAARDIVNNEK